MSLGYVGRNDNLKDLKDPKGGMDFSAAPVPVSAFDWELEKSKETEGPRVWGLDFGVESFRFEVYG